MQDFAKYKPENGKLTNPPNVEEGWYVFDLLGKPAYADTGLVLIGKPPSKRVSPRKLGARSIEAALPKRSAQIQPAGFDHGDGYCRIYFAGLGNPIDARYYDHVLRAFPDATFHAPKKNDATNPIAIKSKGEIVGAVMCLRLPGDSL